MNNSFVEIPEWLLNKTFVVEYSPNCHKKWMVRLVGYKQTRIDKKPHVDSNDIIGYGYSLAEAAEDASNVCKHHKEAFKV
jgi:hypothetical protein